MLNKKHPCISLYTHAHIFRVIHTNWQMIELTKYHQIRLTALNDTETNTEINIECVCLTLCSSADWVCWRRRALKGPASFPALPPLPIPVGWQERNMRDFVQNRKIAAQTSIHLTLLNDYDCTDKNKKSHTIRSYSKKVSIMWTWSHLSDVNPINLNIQQL